MSSGGAIETESGADGARGALDRTPARYGGGGGAAETGSNAREVGGGLSDHGDGGRSNSNDSNSGCSSSSSSIARGLLFEVREFYGPTRIVVELVSGGGGSGGGGVGGGGNGGGTVLGACEARLAEALVGRGGGVSGSSSSSMAQRTGNFGLGKGEPDAFPPPLAAVLHVVIGGGGRQRRLWSTSTYVCRWEVLRKGFVGLGSCLVCVPVLSRMVGRERERERRFGPALLVHVFRQRQRQRRRCSVVGVAECSGRVLSGVVAC